MSDLKKYPDWFIQLMQDVVDMRDAQKEYFQQSSERRLKIAKVRESKVDTHVDAFIKIGIIAHKEKPKDNQQDLFAQNTQ